MCTCSPLPASKKKPSVPLGIVIPKKDRWCGHFSLKPLRRMACRLSDKTKRDKHMDSVPCFYHYL